MRFADFAALLPVFLGKIVSFPEKTSEDEAGPLLPERKAPKFRNAFGTENEFVDLGAASLAGHVFVGKGKGNRLSIGKQTKFRGTIEVVGNNNNIMIGDNCHFRGQIVVKGNGQTIRFGNNSTTVDVYILCQEDCDVTIGEWCMLSREIEIRTTDAHSVVDRATGRRINAPKSVTIGDHVWIGVGAIINKGAVVPSDSIVGAMAFVNQRFEEQGVVLAGTPATIVKRGITWNRSRKAKFTAAELDHWKPTDVS